MTSRPLPSITLNDGAVLPSVGFGTYKLHGATGVLGMAQPSNAATVCSTQPSTMRMRVRWAPRSAKQAFHAENCG